MENEKEIFLEKFINELENLRRSLKKQYSRYFGVHYYTYLEQDMARYNEWKEKVKRYLNINYPGDSQCKDFEKLCNQKISPEQHDKLLAILKAFKSMPESVPCSSTVNNKENIVANPISITANISNSNNQTQNQQQTLNIEIFFKAIKNNLTEKQIKELKEIVSDHNNDLNKARPAIIAKLKNFGSDVLSNIVANLLTNTSIWEGLYKNIF